MEFDEKPRRMFGPGSERPPAEREFGEGQLLLITDGCFFSPRDKDMLPRPGNLFSTIVLERLQEATKDKMVIVCLDDEHEWMRAPLEAGGVKIFTVKRDQVSDTSLRLVTVLKDNSIRMHPIRNIRTVSYLNIKKFVNDERLQVLGPQDYQLIGIEPEKELTFDDYAKKRSRQAWP